MSSGTGGFLAVPVDPKVRRVEAVLGAGLPLVVGTRGAQQFHAVVAPTGHQQLGINVARVDYMAVRQQGSVGQRLMDFRRRVAVCDGPGRRLHVRDQVQRVGITGHG